MFVWIRPSPASCSLLNWFPAFWFLSNEILDVAILWEKSNLDWVFGLGFFPTRREMVACEGEQIGWNKRNKWWNTIFRNQGGHFAKWASVWLDVESRSSKTTDILWRNSNTAQSQSLQYFLIYLFTPRWSLRFLCTEIHRVRIQKEMICIETVWTLSSGWFEIIALKCWGVESVCVRLNKWFTKQ